jgi:glucosylceramidase
MDGFGAAFTDSAAYLLELVEPTATQASTFGDLFTRTGNGIGLSFMRLPMGASDIARTEYTFDDLSSGTDPSLNNFSIAHDQAYVLPLVSAAKTLNPSLKLMANPWSPPAWMKDSGSINGGNLLSSMYAPFANYFVKYIQAYASAGVPVDYISLQNEPLYVPHNYPSMGMDATTQTTVLRDYVLPALTAAKLTTQVMVYDHNWDNQGYPEQVLQDPAILASPLVAGVAWHGYGGTSGAQQSVQNLFPTKGTWETEHSGGTFTSDQFSSDFMEITQVVRNSAKGYLKWSLALNENRGPNLTNIGLGGCNTCSGIVTVNSTTGAVTKTIEYYTLGHYSKYVLPGAKRVYSSNGIYTSTAAFLNPDGSKALVVYNNSSLSQTFQVQWGVQSFSYTLPGYGAATFTWSGTQNGTSLLTATSEIQGSDYSSQFGLQTETTGDATGAYDLGYVNNNAYAMYNNVNFGATSPTKVLVRTASAGNGGTLEFHLDTVAGTLLGTATLPVTGGYQTYQTVSAPITSVVTGAHSLYIVFRGSGGIANVNWFQFQ